MAESGTIKRVDTQEFTEIVSLTKKLIESAAIRVTISLPGGVNLQFEHEKIEPLVAMSFADVKRFESLVKGQIADMISAILSRRKNAYASFAIDRLKDEAKGEGKFDEEAERKSIDEKMNLVEKQLVTPTIWRIFAIKKTSKANVFHKLSWEINEKHFDESGDQAEHLVFATIRLELQKTPAFDYPIFPLRIFGPETVSTIFDASLEDVRELQETLAEVRKKMEGLEKRRQE